MAGEGCPVCEAENMGTWIFTHLNPPATVRSCEEHVAFNLITLLAIQLDMPGEVLYEIIQTGITPEPEQLAPAEEPVAKAAPKRSRKPRMAAEPVEEVREDVVDA